MNLTPAAAWRQAGAVVLPAATDGTKRPAVPWKTWTQRRPTDTEQADFPTTDGIGVVCGAVSGNLEMLEVEGTAVHDGILTRLTATLRHHHLDDLFDRIVHGYSEYTPRGGIHWFWKVTDGPARPNTRLARRTNPDNTTDVLIETRGEGGWTIVAPSRGRTHPNGGEWVLRHGGPATIAHITTAERDALFDALRTLDHTPPAPVAPATTTAAPATTPAPGELRPGDDYNQRATWESILEPHGWRRLWPLGTGWAWRRPGKTDGISATTGQADDADRLYVFSTSTVFDTETPYNKFAAYTLLEHGGDHAAASRHLRAAGYGGERPADTFDKLLTHTATPTTPTNPAQPGPAPDPDDPTHRQHLIRRRADDILLTEEARDLARQLRAGPPAPLTAHTLHQFLQQPDEEAQWLVHDLWPQHGRVILSAAAKSGKTTMVTNLARTLADGGDFLGRYPTTPIPADRTLVILNLEVTEAQMRRWLRRSGITNTQRVIIANLRGNLAALNLSTPEGRQRVADWLRELNAETVILDPLAPLLATLGLDENSNSDVAAFFAWWSETLHTAGVHSDLICHHTGHGDNGRSRGASRLMDEPDAIWTLTRDKQGPDDDGDGFFDTEPRWFKAWGRDVDAPERELRYNPDTGELTLGLLDRRRAAAAGKEQQRQAAELERERVVAEALHTARHTGLSRRDIESLGGTKDKNWAALVRLLAAGKAREATDGKWPRYYPTLPTLLENPAAQPVENPTSRTSRNVPRDTRDVVDNSMSRTSRNVPRDVRDTPAGRQATGREVSRGSQGSRRDLGPGTFRASRVGAGSEEENTIEPAGTFPTGPADGTGRDVPGRSA